MKVCAKNVVRILIIFLVFTAAAGLRDTARSETKKEYLFGVMADSSATSGQYKDILNRNLKVFNRKTSFTVKMKFYIDENEFIKDVKDRRLDLLYSGRPDLDFIAFKKYGYKPLISFNLYGKKGDRLCVYSKKNSRVNKISDAKDGKILICGLKSDYYKIRKLLGGTSPENYFNNVRFQKNPSSCGSFFYSLSLDESDYVFASETVEELYKLNNPGPVKNVKKIACSALEPHFFLSYSKNMPENDLREIREMIIKSPTEPELKDLLPLMRITKFKFVPVTINDYRSTLELFMEAEKKGWEKDLNRLLEMQED